MSDHPPEKRSEPDITQILADCQERIDRGEPLERDKLLLENPEFADQLQSFFSAEQDMAGSQDSFRNRGAEVVDDSNEKPVERADQRVLIHDFCDEYERDRQADSTISMQSYIEKAPEAIKSWVLKELLAIELDILEMSGETRTKESLFKSTGVSTASFDVAWEQLQQEEANHGPDSNATKSGNKDETQIRRRRSVSQTTALFHGSTLESNSPYSTIGAAEVSATGATKAAGLVADDFELLNMLGEGGMGIVYRAYQHSLQRQVALKLIPQRFMNSTQVIARFYIEAEAAAAMDHPGIVPVYEFGERNGIHYYAMALVEGDNLSKYVGSIKKTPQKRMANRQIAEIMRKVALAVQYAHDHAVIHRDIKPANILVNAQGDPRLADFGLAKNLDKSEESLTLTGNVLGTPSYMAPEQASGDKIMVSNRTDVYALGATIYALLAARAPFEGGGQYEIVKKVLESNPASLTVVAPDTPLDLQTICEKCLAKRPQDRYDSANDLADDLQRYLDGYPISARPIGPFRKIASWCRRNPMVASLIGGVWAALIVGAMVSTYFWLQAEDSLMKLKDNLSGTFEVVDDKLSGDDPVSQSARREILEYQKSYYDDLISELQSDASLRREFAVAHFKLGEVQAALSLDTEARKAFESALAVQKKLSLENNSDAGLLASLARTHHELSKLGKKLWDRNRSLDTPEETETAHRGMEEWIQHSQLALDLRRQVVSLTPKHAESHRLVASSQESCAMAQVEQGRASEDVSEIKKGLNLLDLAQQSRETSLVRFDHVPKIRFEMANDLARGYGNVALAELDMASIFFARGAQQESSQAWKRTTEAALQAIRKYASAGSELLNDLNARSDRANCYKIRGDAFFNLMQYDEAASSYENSIQEMQWVCSRNPLVYRYRKMLSYYQFQLAYCHFAKGQHDEGVQAMHNFRETLIESLRAAPENQDATKLIMSKTIGISHVFSAPNTEDLKAIRSILHGAISDLQNLTDKSSEYSWLIPTIDKLKSVLQSIEEQVSDPEDIST